MLLDLGRNDVGRVAKTGSGQGHRADGHRALLARDAHRLQRRGQAEARRLDALDVLRATFPAGTVSGAPKVRAMEIIDELEPTKRGIYAGAVGYLGFNGDMDLAIAIRTAVIKDGRSTSRPAPASSPTPIPTREWQETQNKARALLRAAEMAEAGLDTRFD